MKMPLIIVAFAFILVAVVVNVTNGVRVLEKKDVVTRNVLSDEDTQTGNGNEPAKATSAPINPTIIPSPTRTVNDQPSIASSRHLDMNNFLYPNAQIMSQSLTALNMQITDDPDTVTNWYKDKIKSLGFNITSFVATKTNGDVLNKLVASEKDGEIRVEIQKSANSRLVKITVDSSAY